MQSSENSVPSSRSAFTLMEMMIAVSLFGLVMAGTLSVYIMCNKLWHATSSNMRSVMESSMAMSRIVYGIESDSGLRTANMITVSSNFSGAWDGTNYWQTGSRPPLPGSPLHSLVSGSADGSWRMVISNGFVGVKYIDYNRNQRNLVFWPDIASSAGRQLIGNYVSSATAATNPNGTVSIQLTVEHRDGMFASINTVSTAIKKRNK